MASCNQRDFLGACCWSCMIYKSPKAATESGVKQRSGTAAAHRTPRDPSSRSRTNQWDSILKLKSHETFLGSQLCKMQDTSQGKYPRRLLMFNIWSFVTQWQSVMITTTVNLPFAVVWRTVCGVPWSETCVQSNIYSLGALAMAALEQHDSSRTVS